MAVPGRAIDAKDSEGEVEKPAASSGGEAKAMFANEDGKNSNDSLENIVLSVSYRGKMTISL
jgi:hypothetical protein